MEDNQWVYRKLQHNPKRKAKEKIKISRDVTFHIEVNKSLDTAKYSI